MQSTKKVAIIGAGPAGLVTAKTLLYHYPKGYFTPTVFESKSVVGGLWAVSQHKNGGEKISNGNRDLLLDCYMRTNLSRYTVSFSDHSWNLHDNDRDAGDSPDQKNDEDGDMFPQAWQVGEYLSSYAKRFLPAQTLKLSCRVVRTQRNNPPEETERTKKWTVEWIEEDGLHERKPPQSDSFDYLVVASGYFSRPWIPPIPGLDQFPPERVLHSSSLRSSSNRRVAELLKDNNSGGSTILVVGGSMSGAEAAASIALDLSSSANPEDISTPPPPKPATAVRHLVTRPFWAVPTYLPASDQPGSFLPLDLVMYDLSRRTPGDIQYALGPVTPARANMVHAYFEALIGSNQSDISEELALTTPRDRDSAPWVAVTDHYAGFVRSGDIIPTAGRLKAAHWPAADTNVVADTNGAAGVVEIQRTHDGSTLRIDDIAGIVFATGFTPFDSLSILPEDVLRTLEYTESDTVFPILLDEKAVRNAKIPDLGFVGMYRGPYWGVMEMQARSLANQWSIEHTSPSSLSSSIEEVLSTTQIQNLRTPSSSGQQQLSKVRAQFPMGDYVGLMETFARELQIPRKPLHNENPDSNNLLEGARSGPVLPARYFVSAANANTGENASGNAGIINSVRDLLQSDPDSCLSTPHKERQRGLSKIILRGLHGPWRYTRSRTRPYHAQQATTSGQAVVYLQRTPSSGHDLQSGQTTRFIYEDDSATSGGNFESRIIFHIGEDGCIGITRNGNTPLKEVGKLRFDLLEKITTEENTSTPYHYRHVAKKVVDISSNAKTAHTFTFDVRGVTLTSWTVTIDHQDDANTVTTTEYRRPDPF